MTENILLYFSDTGRGHRSATEAVQQAINEIAAQEFPHRKFNVIADPVAEKSHPVNRVFVELYNHLLRNHQYLMKYYYGVIHAIKPNESQMGYNLVKDYLRRQMIDYKPSVVVSMHPMTNHYLTRAMRDVGLSGEVKFVEIVTDPNRDLWKGWACPAADYIVVPNDLVADQLNQWGVSEEQLQVLGMPVHPDFTRPARVSRQEFLEHLGLVPEVPTLCINAGWAGGGNMLSAYEALQASDADMQVVFLCGHNQNLYESARELASRSPIPTAVLPFHDSMPDLMNAVDTMVTKAGGLTTFECLARRLPMIIDMITEPMPQERGTIDMLIGQGKAKALRKPEDIVRHVRQLYYDPTRYQRKAAGPQSVNQAHAVFDIARLILNSCADPGVAGNERMGEERRQQENDRKDK